MPNLDALEKAAMDANTKARNEWSAAVDEWSAKNDTKLAALSAWREAETVAKKAGDEWAEAAGKAGVAQKVIDNTAASAKFIIGAFTGAFQTALSVITIKSAEKKSVKGNVTDICDKTMALLQAYDPDLTTQDLKEYAKAKMA